MKSLGVCRVCVAILRAAGIHGSEAGMRMATMAKGGMRCTRSLDGIFFFEQSGCIPLRAGTE